MKLALISTLLLPLLLSCGEDYGKGRRSTADKKQPGEFITADSGTPAHLHRDNNQTVMSSRDAVAYLLDSSIQRDEIRSIPLRDKDDEGSERNVKTLADAKGRPGVSCGMKPELTLQGKISDCRDKNKERSVWEATRLGAAGEADWKLVARDNFGLEIWIDMRTNMLWADASSGANWCEASGNMEKDCKDLLAGFDKRICQDIGSVANITWRLPTRNDYLQADLDGIRFVLPTNIEEGFWTATMDSNSTLRDKAWTYESQQGTLRSAAIRSLKPVRCIGAMKI